ncbi:MAG: hypothetical protein ABI399_10710 [Bauldia sp.]
MGNRKNELRRLLSASLVAGTLGAFAIVGAAVLAIESAPPAYAAKKKKPVQVEPGMPDDPAASPDIGNSADLNDTMADPEADGLVEAPDGTGDAPAAEGEDTGSGDGPMDGGSGDSPAVGIKLDDTPGPAIELAEGAGAIPGVFMLQARLTREGAPLPAGVNFRVFDNTRGPDGKLAEIGEAEGGTATLKLQPGTYLVHASYGRAGATKRITVDAVSPGDTVVLNAGGLRLSALVGKDRKLPPGLVKFDIYAPDEDGSDERPLLVENCPADKIVGLNAGIYHVISRYGDANAVVRADIKVEPGKLTEATVYQKAALLTLKLVDQHGGEAIADTAWTVKTDTGDNVVENVGAFPSVVLAMGAYKAIARHDGRTFEREFTVEPGRDRDIEVIAE